MAKSRESIVSTGPSLENAGPLARKVLDYEQTVKRLVPTVKDAADWAPLSKLVAVDEFERVGTFLEVQNWQQYTEMLTKWASAESSFETTVRRISELHGLVYFEIEERHFQGDDVIVVNSLTIFEFDDDDKIRHLDVFLQRPR
jgi:hypothetical protein